MSNVSREAFVAVVRRSDDPSDQETEVATLEYIDGALRSIDFTDGSSIEFVRPATEAEERKAA